MLPGGNQRPQGVTIPDSQLRSGETGQPNTVAHVVPMQPYAVQYFDEHGHAHSTIVWKSGDMVYFDRNAERWAAGLAQAAPYIKDAVNAEYAVQTAPEAPTGADAVDVIASEISDAQNQEASQ